MNANVKLIFIAMALAILAGVVLLYSILFIFVQEYIDN